MDNKTDLGERTITGLNHLDKIHAVQVICEVACYPNRFSGMMLLCMQADISCYFTENGCL